jgi:hypothetical protein
MPEANKMAEQTILTAVDQGDSAESLEECALLQGKCILSVNEPL